MATPKTAAAWTAARRVHRKEQHQPLRTSSLLRLVLRLSAVLLAGVRLGAGDGSLPVITIQGKLIYRTAHVRDIWVLVPSGGAPVYKLPGQPRDSESNPIPAASSVRLDCALGPGGGSTTQRCDRVTNAEVVRAAAPVKSVGLAFQMLVLVIGVSGSCSRRSSPVNTVSRAYTQQGGYMDFMKGCSYNRTIIDPQTFKVLGVTIPCTPEVLQCSEDDIAHAALAAAEKQLGPVAVASYNQYSYIMPDIGASCDWVGLAEVPGRQAWYAPVREGFFDKGTWLQELLHNLGIYHGWRGNAEYGDKSTAMGDGRSCPSAPELWRLGWATPADTLNDTNLPAKRAQSYILPATIYGPEGVMLKIQPTWLKDAYVRNVYLAYRVRQGPDRDLYFWFDRQLHIHELRNGIDNNFFARGDPRVTIIDTVSALSSYELTDYRLLITTGDLLNSESEMAVTVCRYDKNPGECPSPEPLPPAPPPPPKPPVLSPPPKSPPTPASSLSPAAAAFKPSPPPPKGSSPPPSPRSLRSPSQPTNPLRPPRPPRSPAPPRPRSSR